MTFVIFVVIKSLIYGGIAQLGSRMKNARKGIFYRKRRSSPASKVAIAPRSEQMGTSDRTAECKFKNYGGIAQLGERLHGMQEVSGSIPLTSTNKTRNGACPRFLFC